MWVPRWPALEGLGADRTPAKLVVILGGDGKGQDFTPLTAPLARHARAVATIGRDAALIEAVVQGVKVQRFDTLPAAVAWCFEQAKPGDAVLLSPACASLDMFKNYAHRAAVFVQAVQQLGADLGAVA
jgi:UDP-N-acetylmuramoylalanine--D-glutamate ligase